MPVSRIFMLGPGVVKTRSKHHWLRRMALGGLSLIVFTSISSAQIALRPLGDIDNDGKATVFDLVRLLAHIQASPSLPSSDIPFADLNQDGVINQSDVHILTDAILGISSLPAFPLTGIRESSPAKGETGVAVTRETIFRFTAPLASDTQFTKTNLNAVFGGRSILSRIEFSPDHQTVSLFYLEPLPGSARIRVSLDGTGIRDFRGVAIDVDGDQLPGGTALLEFETLSQSPLANNIVCGRVFASELAVQSVAGTNMSVNVPLQGVTITADGLEQSVRAVTDVFGNFRLTNAPAGKFFVHVDGRTVKHYKPTDDYYPFVGKEWESTVGREANVGEIYLPKIPAGTLQSVSPVQSTTVTFPTNVLNLHPELTGVSVTVPANSLFSDNGARGGMVGIAPVPPDRLPQKLPEGLSFPLVITVQTDGPQNFSQPAPVCFPNLPDPATGKKLPPGAKTALWSFNHDLGRWEVVGPMTVSTDGRFACSDPGVGIRQPGWHGAAPGTSGDGGDVDDNSPDDSPPSEWSEVPDASPNASDQVCGGESAKQDNGTDPVHLFSGEFFLHDTDLRIPGVGLDFIWSRKYRSKVDRITPQGHGWEFSYNVYLQREGSSLRLYDGNGRDDVFLYAGPGRWSRRGFFRDLTTNQFGGFTMVFESSGRWEFLRPTTNGVAKLEKIVDRNGNTLELRYSPDGKLITVLDTLRRPISIAYNADGFISSVTDFSGRVVRYDYYQDGDADGSAGDVKSVTSPAVVGTPNGNDFPEGKKTIYTYAARSKAIDLRHRLLTITDGRRNNPEDPTAGQGPYLINSYGEDSRDPMAYGRVVRQVWGGGALDMSYDRIQVGLRVFSPWMFDSIRSYLISFYSFDSPTPGLADLGENHFPQLAESCNCVAIYIPPPPPPPEPIWGTLAQIADRAGHFRRYVYDGGNRLLSEEDLTGRGLDYATITNSSFSVVRRRKNLPALRATDPDSYETRQSYNRHYRVSAVKHPKGNITADLYQGDASSTVDLRSAGNLIARNRFPDSRGGDQSKLIEGFAYDTGFGSCCAFNFVTNQIDARGNSLISQYDEHGNLTNRIHRISSITDQWEYNSRGQMTRHVLPDNGSGHRRTDVYTYYETGPQRGYLHESIVDVGHANLTTSYEHDVRGNVVRKTDPRGHDSQYVYNALDQVVRQISREVTDGSSVRYQRDYSYDANNNLVRVDIQNLDDEGKLQPNTHLTTTYQYDILNHVTEKAEELEEGRSVVTEYRYDANWNLSDVIFGEAVAGRQLDNRVHYDYDERDLLFREVRAPGSVSQSTTQYDYDENRNLIRMITGLESRPRTNTLVYDGFDRLVAILDPMGNTLTNRYDPNGNVVQESVYGELVDVPGSAGNVRLKAATRDYDAMNRLRQADTAFFNSTNQAPIGTGVASTRIEWNGVSQMVRLVNANGHATTVTYDTANRRRMITDAKGNQILLDHDPNNNVIGITEVEKSDLGTPDEVFVRSLTYDNQDRLTRMVDGVGTTNRFGYDSRGNRVLSIDGRGNQIRHEFDGLSRLTQTVRTMTDTGDGRGKVIGTIRTRQTWDDTGRLTSQIDDNGNATTYLYDGLSRKFATVYADGTGQTNWLDVHGNAIRSTDANGNVVVSTYDLLNRVQRKDVTVGPGVSDDTTFEVYQYDGLSRLVLAQDDDSVVQLAYDSLAHVIADIQSGVPVRADFDAMGNMQRLFYPSGRVVTNLFDELERKKTIQDQDGLIARYDYVGPSRVSRRDYGNGTRMTYQYDGIQGVPNSLRDFGFKQITRTTHSRIGDGSVFDDRSYTWDRAGNKTSHHELHSGGVAKDYVYDSIDRLIQSVETPPSGPATTIQYVLDGVGNRVRVVGGPDAGDYTMSATLPEPGDRQMNQYSTTPSERWLYDGAGGVKSIIRSTGTSLTNRYSYGGHLVAVESSLGGLGVAFRYDALGRQVEKAASWLPTQQEFYRYSGWQIVESEGSSDQHSFAYGNYIDELLQTRGSSPPAYLHQDALFSVVGLTEAAGGISSRWRYGDFGRGYAFDTNYVGIERGRQPLDGYFAGLPAEVPGRFRLHRTRSLDISTGRFISRDPLGIWEDALNIGNAQTYVGNQPQVLLDPLGLRSCHAVAIQDSRILSIVKLLSEDPAFSHFANDRSYQWLGDYGISAGTARNVVLATSEALNNPSKLLPWNEGLTGGQEGSATYGFVCAGIAGLGAESINREVINGRFKNLIATSISTWDRNHTAILVSIGPFTNPQDVQRVVLDYHATLNAAQPCIQTVEEFLGPPVPRPLEWHPLPGEVLF